MGAQAVLAQGSSHFALSISVARSEMTLAVYHKLWATTANWTQRKTFGWFQVYSRLAPWSFAVVPAAAWFTFPWWSDDWKKTASLGIYEPPLCHWDTNMTNNRSEFVKFHAQYPGIPYK